MYVGSKWKKQQYNRIIKKNELKKEKKGRRKLIMDRWHGQLGHKK